MNDATRSKFLNVDLDLASCQDLTALVQAFEPAAYALHCIARDDRYIATLELGSCPNDPETAILEFVMLIENLPPHAQGLWQAASKRDFAIGVDAGQTPSSFELALGPTILERVARVQARIVFVVYVHEPSRASVSNE